MAIEIVDLIYPLNMVILHCYVWFPEGFTPGVGACFQNQDATGHTIYGDIGIHLRDTLNQHLSLGPIFVTTRWAPTKLVYTHFVNPFTMCLFS